MDFVNLVYNTTTNVYTTTGQAVTTMVNRMKVLEPGKFITIGFLKTSTTWTRTQATSAHRALALAAEHVARNVLGYPNTFAIRMGRGISRFPSTSEADYTVLIYWNRSFDNFQVYETDDNGQITTKSIVGDAYESQLYLQLLCSRDSELPVNVRDVQTPTNDDSNHDDITSDAASASDTQRNDPDRLSTIIEEDEIDLDALAHEAYFNVDDETPEVTAEYAERYSDERITVQEGLHYFTAGADDSNSNQPNETDNDGNTFVELLFPGETSKLILDSAPPSGACARMRVYTAGVKKAVISTDTDVFNTGRISDLRKGSNSRHPRRAYDLDRSQMF